MQEKGKTKIFTVTELKSSAKKKIRGGEIFVKGVSCGFRVGDEYISYRKGYTTGYFSYSAQGKTQFLIEQLIHTAKEAGWKHAIWLTETGKKEEIIMDFVMSFTGKSYFDPDNYPTEEEEDAALTWLQNHIYIIDHEEAMLNLQDIYKAVAEFERTTGIKMDTVSIDNASNLSREPGFEKLSVAEYMNYLMRTTARTSLKENYHTFILFHLNKPDYMMECAHQKKQGGEYRYHPAPNHYNISGGQQINFLGFQLVGIYRPISKKSQYGILNPETGLPFELNETHVIVTKSKPKAIGKEGSFVLFFDKSRQKYFEKDGFLQKKYYCGELLNSYGGGAVIPVVEKKTSLLDDDDLF